VIVIQCPSPPIAAVSDAVLPPGEAYRRWAPTYADETVVSFLENRLVESVSPHVFHRRLLDVGCGTGRRIQAVRGAPDLAVGVDLVPEMVIAGRRLLSDEGMRVAGDVLELPLRSSTFDLVWCRLVLGHLSDLFAAYRELARVSRPGADLIVSDFHAEAVRAGHARTFRDAAGAVHRIEHHVHTRADHALAAQTSGWRETHVLEAAAGEPERPFYERAGRIDQLAAESALPLVLVMCYRR
jgi:malonyl-CoA O-methyltransferase